ncbi:hypothetical protein [Pseudoalteromonas spongiae]|uniref:hypothetical protein n=1 Tax=Pseudoalteromonas spongiae TaxID=298657 RepID=UPI00026C955D|nr:hypothetical protein [Pseudoalteromonas spongiae]ATC98118.1 hypothetical protein PSPO_a0971 [Pseudoalteromonas spongiae UST010723-006]TMO83741.1 hypothetical protein CWC15_13660 [Pseudoalteromonas spongiae]
MENLIFLSTNLTIVALCIGAFFISNTKVIKLFAAISLVALFIMQSMNTAPQQHLSNITLILINAFYLFKVYTQYQLEQN